MRLTLRARYLAAHSVEWIHVYIFRHWPYWTCLWVSYIWPDLDHDCWFCRLHGWKTLEEMKEEES